MVPTICESMRNCNSQAQILTVCFDCGLQVWSTVCMTLVHVETGDVITTLLFDRQSVYLWCMFGQGMWLWTLLRHTSNSPE